jgi:hypothetical protein
VEVSDGFSSLPIQLPREPPSKSQGARVRLPPLHGSSSQPLFGSDPEHEVLIDEWVALFSRKYGRTVSREEARQMTERLVALFKLLMEWNNVAESRNTT